MKEEIIHISNHGPYKYTPIKPVKYRENKKGIPIKSILLLDIFTIGFYKIYWFYKNSNYIKEDSSIFRTILLFVPFINLYIYYNYLKEINLLLKNKNLETFNNVTNTLFFFIPIIGLWSIINIQKHLNKYWKITFKNTTRKNLNGLEKVSLVTIILIEITYIILLNLIYC